MVSDLEHITQFGISNGNDSTLISGHFFIYYHFGVGACFAECCHFRGEKESKAGAVVLECHLPFFSLHNAPLRASNSFYTSCGFFFLCAFLVSLG